MRSYTKAELEIIGKERPDLIELPKTPLDSIIVEFLKNYDVFVSPVTSKTNKRGEAAIAGAITGAFGPDVGGDAFIVSGQNKQTQVQEWTQWKQWALDHKDFPAYKEKALEKIRKHNENVALQLAKKEVQDEIENLLKKDKDLSKGNAVLGALIVGVILTPIVIQYIQRNFSTIRPEEKIEITCLNCVKPTYPYEALRVGKEGKVKTQIWVREDGSVDQAEIISSSGSDLLDNAALEAAKKSTFLPISRPSSITIDYVLSIK